MNFQSLDLNKVLDDFDQNMRKDYDILFSAIKRNNTSGDKLDEASLIVVVKQFHHVVVRLNNSHVAIVNEILKIEWSKKSNELSQEYQSFVLDLLTVQTALYLHECLKTNVDQFIPKGAYSMPRFFSDMSAEEQEKIKSESQKRHDLLKKITRIVPSSVMILENLLSQCNPLVGNPNAQESYTVNLLQVTGYLPKLRGLVFKLIMSNMITYDSESSREEIQRMENEHVGILSLEDADELDSEMKNSSKKMKHNQANMLDCLMNIMFAYIRDQCFQNGELMWDATKKLYVDLKRTFGSLLLRTFKTCHVQFIMFYVCSFKTDLALDFLEFLWTEVTSLNKDYIHRQLAASYLGSLLARAKYFPTWVIKRQLVRMKEWIHNYIDNSSDQYRPLFEVHGVFYMVCQSFFYIIVFRHKDIIDTSQGHKFCMDLHLQKMSSCLLNPLRFCYLPIAETFCSIVRGNQIAFCDNVLERNRRQIIAESNSYFRNFIISYFPFDPYALLRSVEYIQPHYLDYAEEMLKMNVKQDTLDEEMDYEEFEEKDSLTFNISQNIDIQLSPKIKNFFLYSTSPGFKH